MALTAEEVGAAVTAQGMAAATAITVDLVLGDARIAVEQARGEAREASRDAPGGGAAPRSVTARLPGRIRAGRATRRCDDEEAP